jgi:hypothetical protein
MDATAPAHLTWRWRVIARVVIVVVRLLRWRIDVQRPGARAPAWRSGPGLQPPLLRRLRDGGMADHPNPAATVAVPREAGDLDQLEARMGRPLGAGHPGGPVLSEQSDGGVRWRRRGTALRRSGGRGTRADHLALLRVAAAADRCCPDGAGRGRPDRPGRGVGHPAGADQGRPEAAHPQAPGHRAVRGAARRGPCTTIRSL